MKRSIAIPLLVLCAATAVAGEKGKAADTIHADKNKMEGKAPSDADLIASAMKAAPASVAKGATVVAMDGNGMRTLRKGSNGFSCMPDNPATPGPDPMCMDANAMAWIQAYMDHKDPAVGKVGFMYMLAGGTDASNTDPYATKPEAGNHWIKTGPHVMVVGADAAFYDTYPKSPDPDTSQPYVMWAGTKYQHLMAPVH
ncbi:hypothetical protein [Dokdonella sp.]|uniref:hypothetical protein n=1 Tax=Dokdonella sp. TaxID=2291710 RepID=UPI002F42FE53